MQFGSFRHYIVNYISLRSFVNCDIETIEFQCRFYIYTIPAQPSFTNSWYSCLISLTPSSNMFTGVPSSTSPEMQPWNPRRDLTYKNRGVNRAIVSSKMNCKFKNKYTISSKMRRWGLIDYAHYLQINITLGIYKNQINRMITIILIIILFNIYITIK